MPATYTIGTAKAYATIQSAKDAAPGNYSGQGVQTFEVYAGGVSVPPASEYRENVDDLTGTTNTSATDYSRFLAMVTNAGQRATGIVIVGQPTPGSALYIVNMAPYCRIEGFGVTQNGAHNNRVYAILCYTSTGNCRVIGNVVYAIDGDEYALGIANYYGANITYNNIVCNINQGTAGNWWAVGIYLYQPASGLCYYNSVWNITNSGNYGVGIRITGAATVTLKNNIAGAVAGGLTSPAYVGDGAPTVTATNDTSDDDTADDFGGANHQINKSAVDIDFVGVVVGSEDLHIQSGSCCENAGVAIVGYTVDIEGNIRSDPSDIGATEILGTTPLGTPAGVLWNKGARMRCVEVSTADVTLNYTDDEVIFDTTAGNLIAYLPVAHADYVGLQYTLKNKGLAGNIVTVQRDGVDTIDDIAANMTLKDGQAIVLILVASGKWQVASRTPAVFALSRIVELFIDNFRKGATAPADATLGTTPTVPTLYFSAINELVNFHVRVPEDLDVLEDITLHIDIALASVQLNGDALDLTVDYVAVVAESTGKGPAKASTQVTGPLTVTAAKGLAVGDVYTVPITIHHDDGSNPLAGALQLFFEMHMTDVVGVADMHLLGGAIEYTALY